MVVSRAASAVAAVSAAVVTAWSVATAYCAIRSSTTSDHTDGSDCQITSRLTSTPPANQAAL